MTKKPHGGARPGAGRKRVDPPPRRLHVWIAIESDADVTVIKNMTPAERRERLLTAPVSGAFRTVLARLVSDNPWYEAGGGYGKVCVYCGRSMEEYNPREHTADCPIAVGRTALGLSAPR